MRPWVLCSILLASLACELVGLVMFAKGFFPYKTISTSFASLHDLPPLPSLIAPPSTHSVHHHHHHHPETVPPRFGRVVLMLIDALRSDFLYGNDSHFGSMQHLIHTDRAIPFTALASAPTVTLPRLKALTTGAVPGFLDAILNIAESDQSSTLANQDNWIAQLARSPSQRANANQINDAGKVVQKRNIGFFGDDTWIKLFPGLFFRTDGTSSFFAMDTVEVDNNVTRHVAPELAKDDWDVLIFHYLGLDHVGHSGGPKSALMKPKQAEMDAVADTIYQSLVKIDSTSGQELPTLFILCGDHGMNEVGNHGGSSKSETSTSFLFMSSQFEQPQAREKIRAMVDAHRHAHNQEEYQYYKSVRQVDLVPTLSLLMGLPIPRNNVGKLIPELFYNHTEFEKLRALQINAYQVAGVLKNMWSDFEIESSTLLKDYHTSFADQDATFADEREEEEGRGVLTCAGEHSQKKQLACLYTWALAGHASFLKTAGAISKDTSAAYLNADQMLKFQAAEKAYSQFLEDSSSMLSTALSKYDMPLLTNGSMMMAFAVAGFMLCAMQTSLLEDFKTSCLSPRSSPSFSDAKLSSAAQRRKTDRNEINWTVARIVSAVTLILYLVTLFASSFVEEEHQFWYFFGMTWWAVLALISARYLAPISVPSPTKDRRAEEDATEGTRSKWHIPSSTAAAGFCLLQMAILRILRGWNQTGQKYADQIDLRHYLNSTWIGTSWTLFWITMAIITTSLMTLVLSVHLPFGPRYQRQEQQAPTWRTSLVSILQALLVAVILLTSCWITVYKMDLESVYFGVETMSRIHSWMSTISPVGYSMNDGGLTMSGYEMARGCYSALSVIIIMAFSLKFLLVSPAQPPTMPRKDPMETIQKERIATLFTSSMLLGVATLLLILLSRRHNAPIFALFGVQLYLYINWTTLIRFREPTSSLENGEDKDSTVFMDEVDDSDKETSGSLTPAPTFTSLLETPGTKATAPQAQFRSLPGQNSIHSCTILFWALSSFFLLGNSNSIASIDISNAYVGIQAYDIVLTGVLTFVSNWAGPIWWCFAGVIVMQWDMELEMAWARQDQEARLRTAEEKAWKDVGGWKREDKGTMYRTTKRRIMLYRRAVAKSREAAKKAQDQTADALHQPSTMEQPTDISTDVGATRSEDHAQDTHLDEALDREGDLQDGDVFYVYNEEHETYIGSEETFPPPKLCILEHPQQFRRHLLQTRVLDHLIITSLFFGMVLYVLSIAAIILRHHLFIWTVFSPKVLYQFAWTVLYQLVIQVLVIGAGVWTCVAAF